MTKSKAWTSEEVTDLKNMWEAGTSVREIATCLERTPRSVERKAQNMNLEPRKPQPKAPADPNEADYWKGQYKRVSKMLEDERWKKTEIEALVEEVYTIAPRSYKQAPPIKWPKRNGGHAQSAVLLLSDTHIGQVVESDQTLGMGEYNFDVFLARLKRLEQATYSILHDHVTTKVDELVVPILGDMIHGALAHAVEAGQKNTLFTQFYAAGHALSQFLRNLATLVPVVKIHTTVGNHPRWQNQRKMPTDNRYSNLDQFLYAYMEALTKDVSNVQWHITKQPFAAFDVKGYSFQCGHGDNLRGGDKALGIPAHSIGRKLASTMGLNAKMGRPLVNYYCFGHLHKPIQIPHTLGEVIVNGGFPGVDGFGLAEGFQSYWPSQKLFLVHPKFGRAACYDLRLDFEPDGEKPYYEIPETGII
jgi:hypothetical protein